MPSSPDVLRRTTGLQRSFSPYPAMARRPGWATTETDEDGYASARVRLGNAAGLHKVEARVPDATATNLRTTFDLTAVERSNRGWWG